MKGLTEPHGGRVFAESAGPGQGSTFTVVLPLAQAQPAEDGVEQGAARPEGPSRRILVVDDNRDSAESMAAILGLLGHQVRTAFDGLQGVSRRQRSGPSGS